MGLRQHLLCVCGSQREDGHRVQRAAGGHHALRGQQAQRGLQAHQVVETSQNPARPGRVGFWEKLAWPSATDTAEPALKPPDTQPGLNALRHAPCGDRVPLNPQANWFRLVWPMAMAPASSRRCTTVALAAGSVGLSGATGHRHTLSAGCQCPATGRFFSGPCSQRCS